MFADERRRKINLGGASSAQSHAIILDQAKARRLEREALRRKQEQATRIQAWWRGQKEARLVRARMLELFARDMFSITGLRCLALTRDEMALESWSTAVSQDAGHVFRSAAAPDQTSWLILMRQITLLLLKSVAKSPRLDRSAVHLRVLTSIFSPSWYRPTFGSEAVNACAAITRYTLDHGYYSLISQAILAIPIPEVKTSPSLPSLVMLATQPFSLLDPSDPAYSFALEALLSRILVIPLLPNRIPIASLTHLAGHLPFSTLSLIEDRVPQVPLEGQIHLVANLVTFTTPRYAKLPKAALEAYAGLLTGLLNALPVNALDARHAVADGYDSDGETHAQGDVVMLPPLDPRTTKRLDVLFSTGHIQSLTSALQSRTTLVKFLLALATISPARKDDVLRAVQANNGGGLVREIYRVYVRSSALGKDTEMNTLADTTNASSWTYLLFLTYLYNQALTTMGDDEFFSSAVHSSTERPIERNPLSLDDLTTFSRQLMNIAFTLYWRTPDEGFSSPVLARAGIRLNWEGVRDVITKCLVAIHARDSRKPFTPQDHWLVTSSFDVQSFVEAAIFEEKELTSDSNAEVMVSGTRVRPTHSLSARQLAYLSPRLGILNNIPFAIPFPIRVSIFRRFIMNDATARGTSDRYSFEAMRHRTRVHIRRSSVAQDGFDKLAAVDLKGPIEITFVDQFGQEEAGIDGGGVFKEFFTSLCKEVFDTDRGLWLANKKNELYPNPHAYATEPHSLNWYRFVGRILGKALYQGILVDVAFAGFFLAKWLGKQSYLDDLASLDPDLYNGLTFLKHYEGNPEDLSLNFTVAIEEFGTTKSIDLIPNGSNTPVTRENRLQYIYLISHYRLSKQIKLQSEAFFEGLSDMIDPKWLRMFNQQEFQILLGGVNSPIDIEDLRAHTVYGGLYDEKHPTILAFWNVVESFDHEQRRALLRFVSSCSRPPLLGFKELVPQFSIRDAGSNQTRLPTASTCVNLLKLPLYQNEAVLREKLLKSITSNAGFDLS
ncbi:hypothetical protein EYR36_004066 [Pleurotus pulmonarius]|nr:hypothetical protein EYR36_004066 [Pleurotus pulmonarius]KAF4581619.1 hypothetical protein EYR38_002948 [Pleurotus pulmonarius]